MLRKLTALAVALLGLACPTGPARAQVVLSVPKLEAHAGAEVEVPVVVKGGKGLSALQMRLSYDPAVLEVIKGADDQDKGITRGKILPDKAIAKVFTDKPGRLPILFLGGADPDKKVLYALEGDGTLLTIRFKVIGRAGQKTDLTLEKAEAFQKNDMDLAVRTEAGLLTVTEAAAVVEAAGFPWWLLWLALALLLLLLLALLLFFLLRRRSDPDAGKAVSRPRVATLPCPRCGQPVQKGAAFCSQCGAKFVRKTKN